jgi:hypothetical protein
VEPVHWAKVGPAVRARGVVRALEFAGLDLFLFGFSKENLAMKVDRVHQILQVALPMIQEDKTRPLLVAYRQEKMPASVGAMVGATLIGGALLHKMQNVPAPTFQAFLVATYFRDISLFRNSIIERPAYDQHPDASMRLLSAYPGVTEQFRLIVQQHHESPSGTGFPRGLRGLDIFRMAKIPLAAEKLSELLKVRDLSPQDEVAILEDKPIVLDYWTSSLDKTCLIGVRQNNEKLLVKSEDEYTSPIAKIYKVDTEYIIVTANSIYLVSSEISTRRIN